MANNKLINELKKDIRKLARTSHKVLKNNILSEKDYEKLYHKIIKDEEKILLKRTARGERVSIQDKEEVIEKIIKKAEEKSLKINDEDKKTLKGIIRITELNDILRTLEDDNLEDVNLEDVINFSTQ